MFFVPKTQRNWATTFRRPKSGGQIELGFGYPKASPIKRPLFGVTKVRAQLGYVVGTQNLAQLSPHISASQKWEPNWAMF